MKIDIQHLCTPSLELCRKNIPDGKEDTILGILDGQKLLHVYFLPYLGAVRPASYVRSGRTIYLQDSSTLYIS